MLQWGAALFYLLNKIFLWFSERAVRARKDAAARRWRILSWLVYLAGLPPWVAIFIAKHDWIAAALETSGAPAMFLGLAYAWRGATHAPPRWLDHLALAFTIVGLAYSVYDFGGLSTLNQVLEIGLVFGFLIGTYQLAKRQVTGYLWFVLMHLSCAALMWRQDHLLLFAQQLLSLLFIVDAYKLARGNQRALGPGSRDATPRENG